MPRQSRYQSFAKAMDEQAMNDLIEEENVSSEDSVEEVEEEIVEEKSVCYGIVNAPLLNVRKNAGENSELCDSFGPLIDGTEVEIHETVQDSKGADWYYVKVNDNFCYVKAEYIEKV